MRTSALDNMREQERILRLMRRQLDGMSASQIDRKATERNIYRNELSRVRRVTRNAARNALNGDQMKAAQGVRMVRYKRVQGGNINILTRSAGGAEIDSREYNRQGRRFRSERSKLMASYWGSSRSFVLRWLQAGTDNRTAGTRYSSRGGSGNRGAIVARDFMRTARNEMQTAADNVVRQLSFIDELFLKS